MHAMKHMGPTVTTKNGFKVIDCEICGFKHLLPLPTAEELDTYYQKEFYQGHAAAYFKNAQDDIEWKAVEYANRYEIAEGILSSTDGERTVLDIGCGAGEFLDAGKDRGWVVSGVEPSPIAADYVRQKGTEVITGLFNEELSGKLGKYDFIHMSEVLEHLLDPLETLKLTYDLLNPGGVLCISVPNDFSPVQNTLVKAGECEEWWVMPNLHLNYFDFGSLSRIIEKAGYEVVDQTTNFPMELFLLMGQNYTKDPALGKKLHGWRRNMDIMLAKHGEGLYKQFYSMLGRAGFGRLAIVFAQKK